MFSLLVVDPYNLRIKKFKTYYYCIYIYIYMFSSSLPYCWMSQQGNHLVQMRSQPLPSQALAETQFHCRTLSVENYVFSNDMPGMTKSFHCCRLRRAQNIPHPKQGIMLQQPSVYITCKRKCKGGKGETNNILQ